MSKIKNLNKLLPFVAIGTVADCQSVLDPTNRLLVRAGLQMMQNQSFDNSGLTELIKQTGVLEKMQSGYKLTSQDLGFVFSPILNASGRVSHAKLSISTLLSDYPEAGILATELIAANQERKQIVKDILVEVETQAREQILANASFIWLQGDWSKGIVGLIASRLVNQYTVPVIVVSIDEGHASGSLRAPEGYHLPNAMNQMIDLFEKCGGHPCAAGFSATADSLSDIKDGFTRFLAEQKENLVSGEIVFYTKDLVPQHLHHLLVDPKILWLDEGEITTDFIQEVWLLDPFGQDFPFPHLTFTTILTNVKFMGNNQQHFKTILSSGVALTAFNIDSDIQKQLIGGSSISVWITAKISQNSWNGQTKNELIVDKIYLQNAKNG